MRPESETDHRSSGPTEAEPLPTSLVDRLASYY
jgi:hypothetical protein